MEKKIHYSFVNKIVEQLLKEDNFYLREVRKIRVVDVVFAILLLIVSKNNKEVTQELKTKT